MSDMTVCCDSIPDFLENVFLFQKEDVPKDDLEGQKYHRDYSNKLWYRGHAKDSYTLWPTLFREFSKKKSGLSPVKNPGEFYQVLEKTEREYLTTFKARRGHISAKDPGYTWGWYAIMQHYSTPTRLLDWSENAFAACFFALYKYWKRENKIGENEFPCVWVLKPEILNAMRQAKPVSECGKYEEMIPKSYEESDCYALTKYLRKNKRPDEKKLPMAISLSYDSPRILAQSGGFTVFPNPPRNLQSLSEKEIGLETFESAHAFLRKIVFTKPYKVIQQLRTLGFKHFNYYPELDRAAIDIDEEVFPIYDEEGA